MHRWILTSIASVAAAIAPGLPALAQQNSSPLNNPARIIPREQIGAYSAQTGSRVIGSLSSQGHGHVVVGVPRSTNVWDGNILGGFKDLEAGVEVTNPKVIQKLNMVVNGGPQGSLDVSTMTAKEIQPYADAYYRDGAPASYSWSKSNLSRVVWYQVPANQDINEVIRNYKPPEATTTSMENLRCNDLVQKAAPVVKQLVMDEAASRQNVKVPYVSANEIDKALNSLTNPSQRASTTITYPPPPPEEPIYSKTPMQMEVIPKPGGVFITATASVQGLRPEDVASASFDSATGTLHFRLRSGSGISAKLNTDHFAVAVRCVLQAGVDPALSMEYSKEKPDFHAVQYVGPLFQTGFGEILYRTDRALGDVVFNYEGDNQSAAVDLVPGYRDLAHQCARSRSHGSRVFLRAHGARFEVKGSDLFCQGVDTTVEVEGLREASSYYDEALYRLARLLNQHMPTLRATFEEFQEFEELTQCVALAKWIKQNAMVFDWSELATRTVAVKEFPSYAPSSHWTPLFNGRNLDGWRIEAASGEMEWDSQGSSITIKATGANPVKILDDSWYKTYDLRYAVITKGPVDFIIREGSGPSGGSISMDTKGEARTLELFLSEGKWTAVAQGVGQSQPLEIPKTLDNKLRHPNVYGFRIPSGSELSLFSASFRGRH